MPANKMDFMGSCVLPLITALLIQRTQAMELVTESGLEGNCTVSKAEVAGRMLCGNGNITEPDACWDGGCCFLDDPKDNETVNVCYDPINGTEGELAQSTSFNGDNVSSASNLSFKDIIGKVTFDRTPNWELIPRNTTVLFVIRLQRIVTGMTALFLSGDGFLPQNVSFLPIEEEPRYHEARLEHTYRCPGVLYQPILELQGQMKPEDRVEVPAGPVFNVTQELFVDYHEEKNGSTTFAIYTNISNGNISTWMDFDEGNASETVLTLAPFIRDDLPEWVLKRWMERGGESMGYSVGFMNHFYERLSKVRPTVILTIGDCAQNLSYEVEVKAGSLERFRKKLEAMEVSSSSMEMVVFPGESVELIAWIPGDNVTSASFDYGDGDIDERLTIETFDNDDIEEWPAFPRWKAVGAGEVHPKFSFIRLSHVYNESGIYQGRLTVTHDQEPDWTASANVSIKVWNFTDALGQIKFRKNTSDSINPLKFVAFEVTVGRVFCNLTLDVDFGDNTSARDNFERHDGAQLNNLSKYASVLPGSALVVHQYGYRPGVYVVTVQITGCTDPERMESSIVMTTINVRSFSEAIGEAAIITLNRVNLVLCDLTFQLQITNPWPLGEFSVSFGDGTPAEVVPKDTFQVEETPNGIFHVASVKHRYVVPGIFHVNLTIVDTISGSILTFSNTVEVITVRRIVGNISVTTGKDSTVCQGDAMDIAVALERLPGLDLVVSVDFGDGTEPHIVLLTKKSGTVSDLEQYSFVTTQRFTEPGNYTVVVTVLNPCTTEDRIRAELLVEVAKRGSSMAEGRDLDRVLLLVNPSHAERTVVGEEVEFLAAIPEFFEDPRPVLLFLDGSEAAITSSSALNCMTLIPEWLPTTFSFSSARLFLISHRFPRPGVYHVRLKVTHHPGRRGPIFTQASVTVLSLRDAVGSVRIVPDVSSTGNASVLVLAEYYPSNTWTLWNFGDGTPSRRLDLKRNAQLPNFASEFATPGHFSGLLSHTYEAFAVRRFSVTFQVGDGVGPFRNFTREKTIVMKQCDEMTVTFENSAEDDPHLFSVYFWNETIVLRATFTPACYPMEFAGRCVLERRDTMEDGGQSIRLHGLNCSVRWVDPSPKVDVVVHPFVLRSPGFYSVGLEAWFINSKNVITTAQSNKTLIRIEPYRKSLLTVLTRPVTEYNVSETFWLNTTLLEDMHPNEVAFYSWVCLIPGIQPPTTAHNIRHLSECTSEPYRPDRSKSSLELPVSWLSFDPQRLPVVFHFQGLLSTPNRTLASDWISLTIVSGANPLIAIVCQENCEEEVDPSGRVLLTFSCANCGVQERLNKSWDLRLDHQPGTSMTNLSLLFVFLKASPQRDGDVFAIPGQIFQSMERDEFFIVSLQVIRRDATQGSSIRRLKAAASRILQSTTRRRITPGMEEEEENPIVPLSSFSNNEPRRVLTPSFDALHYSNDSSASDQGSSTNLAALATIALLLPAVAILATVIIYGKRRQKRKEREGEEDGRSRVKTIMITT